MFYSERSKIKSKLNLPFAAQRNTSPQGVIQDSETGRGRTRTRESPSATTKDSIMSLKMGFHSPKRHSPSRDRSMTRINVLQRQMTQPSQSPIESMEAPIESKPEPQPLQSAALPSQIPQHAPDPAILERIKKNEKEKFDLNLCTPGPEGDENDPEEDDKNQHEEDDETEEEAVNSFVDTSSTSGVSQLQDTLGKENETQEDTTLHLPMTLDDIDGNDGNTNTNTKSNTNTGMRDRQTDNEMSQDDSGSESEDSNAERPTPGNMEQEIAKSQRLIDRQKNEKKTLKLKEEKDHVHNHFLMAYVTMDNREITWGEIYRDNCHSIVCFIHYITF